MQILTKLQDSEEQKYVAAVQFVWIYIGLDDKDKAFEWLNRAYQDKEPWLAFIKNERIYDSLRDDTRFKKLLKKMRLD